MKKKIIKRYRERIGNRETVCITLSMIPRMIKDDHVWRGCFYRGWSDNELKELYRLLYMSGGHRWMDKDEDLF
tara:strand:+ start:307 stop:525 length:219 start_codon:yes stop_codon:yes gene_type:complete